MVNKLKNVNFMSGTQFDTVEEVSQDELYAVNIENDAMFRSFVSALGLPCTSYRTLTLGTSGSNYTAPRNGYVFFSKTSSAAGQYVNISSNGYGVQVYAPSTNQTIKVTLPVLKGQTFNVQYSLAGTSTSYFRFIYAEGETN